MVEVFVYFCQDNTFKCFGAGDLDEEADGEVAGSGVQLHQSAGLSFEDASLEFVDVREFQLDFLSGEGIL